MGRPVSLAPSILSADFARLADAAAAVHAAASGPGPAAGDVMLHVDVMDGHFVPNLTIGPPVVSSLRRSTDLPLDCHLMVEDPDALLADFAKAGANLISVHLEACRHLDRTVAQIRALGMRPGVALNPHTPVELLQPILPDLDFVLVMSVNPGFGGQRFRPRTLDKVRWLDRWRRDHQPALRIEIDGGMTVETIGAAYQAGVDWFVAGSAIFGGGQGPEAVKDSMAALRKAASAS